MEHQLSHLRNRVLVVVFCFLLGFGLRIYGLDKKSLWIDEIHTFNGSRSTLGQQIELYKKNPTYLDPPLFFVLTHLLYPFSNPERDLRIIPLIAGSLSIPMIYLLAGTFSPQIALPSMIALTLMPSHIYISQDGRAYSLELLLGMIALYSLISYLKTSQKRYLALAAFSYSTLFYLSYRSVLFIVLSQAFWLLRPHPTRRTPRFLSILILNGLILLLCLPWLLFLVTHITGDPLLQPMYTQSLGSYGSILYGMFSDWCLNSPLLIVSIVSLTLFAFLSQQRWNYLLTVVTLVLPPTLLYVFCTLFKINHFVSSKYFINFLSVFLISLFVSVKGIAGMFKNRVVSSYLPLLFVLFFVSSNLFFLPKYYSAEKQDFRNLARYLDNRLENNDTVFVESLAYIPGILHYLGIVPESRDYSIPTSETLISGREFRIALTSQHRTFSIVHSSSCCNQYVADGNRLWIIVGASTYLEIIKNSPAVLVGVFDGSVSYFRRFPSDASMYLLLWEPEIKRGLTQGLPTFSTASIGYLNSSGRN